MKTKLFIGNLGDDGRIKADDLRPLFERFGLVTECECIKNYAFVHMDDDKAALEALQSLNGLSLKGRIIKVEKSESRGPRKPSQKLFIGNIAEGTTADQLRTLFEDFTPVIEADIIKNYGFVHIDAEAGRAKINEIIKELNGYNLNGSNIRVQLSTSNVRQKPGMGGDKCYRCGKEGHWSKECPIYPDNPAGGGFAGTRETSPPRGGSGRGGPVRTSGPQGRFGQSNSRGDPYPASAPPPSYRRERLEGRAPSSTPSSGNPTFGREQAAFSAAGVSVGSQPYGASVAGGHVYQHTPGGQAASISDAYARSAAAAAAAAPLHLQQQQQDLYDRRLAGQSYGAQLAGRDLGGQLRSADPYAQPSYATPMASSAAYIQAGGQPQYQQQPAAQQLQASYAGGFSTAFAGGAFAAPPGGNFAANTASFSALAGSVSYATPNNTYVSPNIYPRRSPGPGPAIGVPTRQITQGAAGAGFGGGASSGHPSSMGGRSGPSSHHSGSYGGGRGDYRVY